MSVRSDERRIVHPATHIGTEMQQNFWSVKKRVLDIHGVLPMGHYDPFFNPRAVAIKRPHRRLPFAPESLEAARPVSFQPAVGIFRAGQGVPVGLCLDRIIQPRDHHRASL